MNTWDLKKVEIDLEKAFKDNSEVQLLDILKKNSFLFYHLYSRKIAIQPSFSELSFSNEMRCDFAWLNDNSDGPEWVLIEIEKPRMRLFNKNGDPSSELNHAIEQVKSWDRHFRENPMEKKRIFGAVSRFRYILVAGTREDWQQEKAIKWRAYHNEVNKIEIRSSDIFFDSLKYAQNHYEDLWSFEENPKSLKHSELKKYWKNYKYMDLWRMIF
ncbi:MAG: DUF4263 domain-containing protein [Bacteroidales bacterium]|nr:DUF4263 domain-containing protein [Bacteroidales bacterium]